HWVKPKLRLSPLLYRRSSGVRLIRSVVTRPVTVLVQFVPVMLASVPLQTYCFRALIIAGLAKPIDTWNPAGPYSWKKLGSPMRRKESCAFWPSSVLVWSHSSPRAIRSAAGVATTPYLPGIRLATTAWPAIGDKVVPSASNFGQVTISPVMPSWVPSPPFEGILAVACAEIGHASSPVSGSRVPARLLDNGMLNMS